VKKKKAGGGIGGLTNNASRGKNVPHAVLEVDSLRRAGRSGGGLVLKGGGEFCVRTPCGERFGYFCLLGGDSGGGKGIRTHRYPLGYSERTVKEFRKQLSWGETI